MCTLGDPPPLGLRDFMAFCRSRLDAELAGALERVELFPGGDPCCRAHRRWQEWETAIRNHLVTLRAAGSGGAPADWQHAQADVFPGDIRQLEEVLGSEDPLRRQLGLDQLRWQRLDEISVGLEFSFDALVVYKLRLLLVERWAAMSEAVGREARDGLVQHGVDQAHGHRETVES